MQLQELPKIREQHPESKKYTKPSRTVTVDPLLVFFLPEPTPVRFASHHAPLCEAFCVLSKALQVCRLP